MVSALLTQSITFGRLLFFTVVLSQLDGQVADLFAAVVICVMKTSKRRLRGTE